MRPAPCQQRGVTGRAEPHAPRKQPACSFVEERESCSSEYRATAEFQASEWAEELTSYESPVFTVSFHYYDRSQR